MEKLFGLVGTILIIAFLSVILKRYLVEYAFVINVAASVLILGILIVWISPIFAEITRLIEISKIPREYEMVLIKCIGIDFLTQFSADSCRDCGEKSLSSKIETLGRTAVIITVLPLFQTIVTAVLNLN